MSNQEQRASVINNITGGNVTQVYQQAKKQGVPVCPRSNAATMYGRVDVINDLIRQLTSSDDGAVAIYALRGLPGVGKTDLVRAVGCDRRITDHFRGGVLYAELGPSPNVANILVGWLRELDIEPPQTNDVTTLANVVRSRIADRPTLIIIDDAWQQSLAEAKQLATCVTSSSRVLASSRSDKIANALTRSTRYTHEIPILDPDPSVAVLWEHAQKAVESDLEGARELAGALGNLPLALKLAGHLVNNDRRSQRPCIALKATWQQRLDELRGDEIRAGINTDELSLNAIIGMSYDALPDDATREAAAALSVFGATPLDWDWDAMAAVWDSDEKTTTILEKAIMASGLLDYSRTTNRYGLHQIIQAFLKQHSTNVQFIGRHSAYYAWHMKNCNRRLRIPSSFQDALTTLDQELWQMDRGRQRARMTAASPWRNKMLIEYAFACDKYFDLRGYFHQKIAWAEDGLVAARDEKDERSVAALTNNIAVTKLNIGRYEEALTAFELALEFFLQNQLHMEVTQILQNMGHIYQITARHEQAIKFYKQAHELSIRIGDKTLESGALTHLGGIFRLRGDYMTALTMMKESLEIKEQLNDTHSTAITLTNIGSVYLQLEQNDEAGRVYKEALVLFEHLGDHPNTANVLTLLGIVYRNRGQYDEGIIAIKKALAIHTSIGDISGVAGGLTNLGTIYRRQNRYEAARNVYEQSLTIFEELGEEDNVETVCWNLGIVLEALGNLTEAMEYMERSVLLREKILADSNERILLSRRAVVREIASRIASGEA